jgi:DNA-binding transcriptional LysR family regulator
MQLSEGILEMVKAGMGATVLPKWSLASALESDGLRAVRITAAGVFRKWYAVTLRDAALTPFAEEFIRLLIAQAPGERHSTGAVSPATRVRARRAPR